MGLILVGNVYLRTAHLIGHTASYHTYSVTAQDLKLYVWIISELSISNLGLTFLVSKPLKVFYWNWKHPPSTIPPKFWECSLWTRLPMLRLQGAKTLYCPRNHLSLFPILGIVNVRTYFDSTIHNAHLLWHRHMGSYKE